MPRKGLDCENGVIASVTSNVVTYSGGVPKGETWALTPSRASDQQPEVRAAGDERGGKGRPLGAA